LGIPLVEIGTSPDIKSPKQCLEAAEKIGMILRSTGKVKRGLGTIRQDVNVSIKDGARIEIKGAQELKQLPKLVENEVMRQLSLLEIKKELLKRNAAVNDEITNVTDIFKETASKIIKNSLAKKGVIFVVPAEIREKEKGVKNGDEIIWDVPNSQKKLKIIMGSDSDKIGSIITAYPD